MIQLPIVVKVCLQQQEQRTLQAVPEIQQQGKQINPPPEKTRKAEVMMAELVKAL
jgi:hypothetical protein